MFGPKSKFVNEAVKIFRSSLCEIQPDLRLSKVFLYFSNINKTGAFNYYVIIKWTKFEPPLSLVCTCSILVAPLPETLKLYYNSPPTSNKNSKLCDFVVSKPPSVISTINITKKCSTDLNVPLFP